MSVKKTLHVRLRLQRESDRVMVRIRVIKQNILTQCERNAPLRKATVEMDRYRGYGYG